MTRILFNSYFFVIILFCLFSYAFIDPNLNYLHFLFTGFSLLHREITTIIYICFISTLYVYYYFFLKESEKGISINKFKKIIASSFILIISYPAMLSYDIFNYVLTAKVLFYYKENPYIIMPIEFLNEPFLHFTRAANKVALYGPSWILLSGIPYGLGFGNFLITLFNFKIFVAFFYLLTLFLIWKKFKNTESLIFFGLNPLVIMETLVSGHNDIVMMFFALFSFFLFLNKKYFTGTFLFLVSIFIKFSTILLIPSLIYIFWKRFKKEEINTNKLFMLNSFLMFVAFLYAPFREEIYPWYAIWFLVFLSPVKNRVLKMVAVIFSFGLTLRYIPFMLTGTYFGLTPLYKNIITFFPVIVFCAYLIFKRRIWKNFYLF